MIKHLIRRIVFLPITLILIHFLGFSYAYIARPIRAARTPYLREVVGYQASLPESYYQYLQDIFHGALLHPLEKGPQLASFAQFLGQSLVASLGLLAIAITLSIFLGFLLGLLAVRNQPVH